MQRNIQKSIPDDIRIIRKPIEATPELENQNRVDQQELSVGNTGRHFQMGDGGGIFRFGDGGHRFSPGGGNRVFRFGGGSEISC